MKFRNKVLFELIWISNHTVYWHDTNLGWKKARFLSQYLPLSFNVVTLQRIDKRVLFKTDIILYLCLNISFKYLEQRRLDQQTKTGERSVYCLFITSTRRIRDDCSGITGELPSPLLRHPCRYPNLILKTFSQKTLCRLFSKRWVYIVITKCLELCYYLLSWVKWY